MKRLNTRQVDWIARDLIFTWGCLVPHAGHVDGAQEDQCRSQAKYMGATWDDALKGRVIKRCEELLPAFERRYGRLVTIPSSMGTALGVKGGVCLGPRYGTK